MNEVTTQHKFGNEAAVQNVLLPLVLSSVLVVVNSMNLQSGLCSVVASTIMLLSPLENTAF